ncbi:hypothetical protein I6G82_08445 [Lysinibacillus macroides]|uniref:Uncharacterized protein n=1 Tax=Lysinibacillus macroides TaxID=33935 RepID=A0A0M9DIG4_9BACI|nr:hypothetical protein [Lysinibacillus macroides]KOY81559.1 hypothetical protein ADM90_14245 [Lysinibacillus macroides]QPR69599.1 hypothetical protein I6G82_08445 [Lysinibacillus macroides]
MLEITEKRLITTRKTHECYGCMGAINKGETVVFIIAKQDEQPIRFHLHQECNIKLAKNKNALDGIYYGCLNDLQPTPQWLAE